MWLQPLPISLLSHWTRRGPMGPPQPRRASVVHSYADWRCCSRPRCGIRRRPCLRRWLRLWCHALVSFRRAYSWAGPTLGHRCDQCAGGYRIFRPPFERLKCLVIKQCLAFGCRQSPSTLPVSPSWDGPHCAKVRDTIPDSHAVGIRLCLRRTSFTLVDPIASSCVGGCGSSRRHSSPDEQIC